MTELWTIARELGVYSRPVADYASAAGRTADWELVHGTLRITQNARNQFRLETFSEEALWERVGVMVELEQKDLTYHNVYMVFQSVQLLNESYTNS